MMRLAAVVLLAILAELPLSVGPSAAPVTWLVALAVAVGGVGIMAWSVPLATAAGALALIAYALALAIAQPPPSVLGALGLGTTLLLLQALVYFASRTRGAAFGPSVIAAQARQGVTVTGLGVVAAVGLVWLAAPLGAGLRSAPLPLVIGAAALGAAVTVAAGVALVTAVGPPRAGGD
jgi:hypothetical protein